MAFVGLILIAAGIALLVLTGNDEIVRSIAEGSTCNERPCTEDEVRTMMTVGGIVALTIGSPMLLIGLVRALRGSDAASSSGSGGSTTGQAPPTMPSGGEVTIEDPGQSSAPVVFSGDPAAQIDQLDAELAAGRLTAEEWQKRRAKLLKKL